MGTIWNWEAKWGAKVRNEKSAESGALVRGNLVDGHPSLVTLVKPYQWGQAERDVCCFGSPAVEEAVDTLRAQEVGVDKMLLCMTLQTVENRYYRFDHFDAVNARAV